MQVRISIRCRAPLRKEDMMSTVPSVVTRFYDMLNQPATKDVARIAGDILRADWRSYSGEAASKGRDEFVAQVQGFGKAIPDLAWSVKETLVDGDRVVVRSE